MVPDSVVAAYGHVGDGDLHFNPITPRYDPQVGILYFNPITTPLAGLLRCYHHYYALVVHIIGCNKLCLVPTRWNFLVGRKAAAE